MSAAPWIKSVRHAVHAATLALALSGVASNAWAQAAVDDDDDIDDHILNTDKRMLESILAPLGLGSASAPAITYRERSPLVVPAGRDLPVPGAKPAKSADWPLEPEIKMKRAAAAERKSVKQPADLGKPISGTPEMYRVDNTGKWDEGKVTKEPTLYDLFASGKAFQLGSNRKEEVGTFTGEPPRTSLIAPPVGYLTPSPAAPYGVTPRTMEIQKKEPKL
jgi:hypothetical protein